MTRPVHLWWLYGMYGPLTDPGSRGFVARFAQQHPAANIHGSPYRDYQVNQVVAEIMAIPLSTAPVIFIGGASLGANNTLVIAAYLKLHGYAGVIHGAFGFQAS